MSQYTEAVSSSSSSGIMGADDNSNREERDYELEKRRHETPWKFHDIVIRDTWTWVKLSNDNAEVRDSLINLSVKHPDLAERVFQYAASERLNPGLAAYMIQNEIVSHIEFTRAIYANDTPIINSFLKHGAKFNSNDLSHAMAGGHLELVKQIMATGLEISQFDINNAATSYKGDTIALLNYLESLGYLPDSSAANGNRQLIKIFIPSAQGPHIAAQNWLASRGIYPTAK